MKLGVPITKHGKRRFKERCGLPARAVRRMAFQALHAGLSPDALPRPARLKVLSQQARYDPTGEGFPKVYKGFIFIFNRADNALVTVYPLNVPDEYMQED